MLSHTPVLYPNEARYTPVIPRNIEIIKKIISFMRMCSLLNSFLSSTFITCNMNNGIINQPLKLKQNWWPSVIGRIKSDSNVTGEPIEKFAYDNTVMTPA